MGCTQGRTGHRRYRGNPWWADGVWAGSIYSRQSKLSEGRICAQGEGAWLRQFHSFKCYGGTVAQLLALPPHSKKVMGSIPTEGAVGSGGQILPRVLHSAQVGYLPGLSVWSLHVLPVFTRGSLH